jgi:hypothetical protein
MFVFLNFTFSAKYLRVDFPAISNIRANFQSTIGSIECRTTATYIDYGHTGRWCERSTEHVAHVSSTGWDPCTRGSVMAGSGAYKHLPIQVWQKDRCGAGGVHRLWVRHRRRPLLNALWSSATSANVNSAKRIDVLARILFPFSFVVFNFVYWYIYLLPYLKIADFYEWPWTLIFVFTFDILSERNKSMSNQEYLLF